VGGSVQRWLVKIMSVEMAVLNDKDSMSPVT
jgi:hypothetical protein